MEITTWKTFRHPAGVYHLEYPASWEQIQQDEARSCGFGPRERDDVGLWISIMPMSVDTDRIAEDLPKVLAQAMPQMEASVFARDESLHHYGLRADIRKEGQGGHYWLLAAGDAILFASTQVPMGERDIWNPLFQRVMTSLRVTRDEELKLRKLAIEVLERLREKHPDEDFQLDEKGIRGRNRVVYLSNLMREVNAFPKRREKIIHHFVTSLVMPAEMGYESWEDAKTRLVPVLKPLAYFQAGGPAQHQLRIDWLGDVKICYALRGDKVIRFVTDWDVGRWETDNDTVHQIALNNLKDLSWPRRMEGASQRDGGRVVIVQTTDSLTSSRLLNPELYQLFQGPFGGVFCAGIPDRDTLVLFSNRKLLKQRIARKLLKDYHTSPYPITPRVFLVTPDGIALA